MSLLLTICVLHLVAQLSPGPDILLIAKCAASTTIANTLKVILGISIGILFWVILTLSGFALLIAQFPWIQQVLMLVSGLFLAKMGWAMLKGGWQTYKSFKLDAIDENQLPLKAEKYFLMGLFTNLSNPKTLIYFSSVFSLALTASAPEMLKIQLAVIIPIQTFLTFTFLMVVLARPKIKQLYQRSGHYIDMASGGLFLIFAVWLWIDALILLN
ncbi:LysE family transporter [Acinetobacter sp. Ver3]|uniref:LysE family transporter n=1 Tax=Acinetobacter sp. Ver3 TaxID=466088 RepID=UPI00044964B5|nr:LysE family transporter [Acinetobacter sp. Ver3]EZQ12509.1 threonine transporter RhtB [Acinetobacter sp. Ver3]